jgi:hypothetical protein
MTLNFGFTKDCGNFVPTGREALPDSLSWVCRSGAYPLAVTMPGLILPVAEALQSERNFSRNRAKLCLPV